MTAVCPCMASCLQDVFRFIPGDKGEAPWSLRVAPWCREHLSLLPLADTRNHTGEDLSHKMCFRVAGRGPVLLVNVPALWEQGYFQNQ